MMKKEKTIHLSAEKFREHYHYKYEPNLTNELDNIGKRDLTSEDIFKMTLWKVARFPQIDNDMLDKLNSLAECKQLDTKLTHDVLDKLLSQRGVRLPMASTYLRFRNPHVYQIIDYHVWHQLYHEKYKELASNKERIILYFKYLKRLKSQCKKDNVDFVDADRFYYEKDKYEEKINKIKRKQLHNLTISK